MKVFGFVVIILGLVMVYVGITGSQHILMATLKGSNNPVASGKAISPSGGQTTTPSTPNGSNPNPPTNPPVTVV